MSNKLNKNNIKTERAQRVKYVRELSKLTGMRSGEEFAKQCGIARSTLTGWESGTNCLTEKGAKKIVIGLGAIGIICNNLWLLYGIGDTPKPRASNGLLGIEYPPVHETSSEKVCESLIKENEAYASEIAIFKQRYAEHLIYQLQDDSMLPLYQFKDCVGGRVIARSQLELTQGKICIVLLTSGELLVRRVKLDSTHLENISFYVINSEFSLDYPPMHQIPIEAIIALAPVIRLWRDF